MYKYDGQTVAVYIQDLASTDWLYVVWTANGGDFQKLEKPTEDTYRNFKLHAATQQPAEMYMFDGPPWLPTSDIIMVGDGNCSLSVNDRQQKQVINIQGTFIELTTGDVYNISSHYGWQNHKK
jgi:hypothetical protein